MESRGGRPREFDTDRAVEQAAHVFWQHGFSGTTTRQLTGALGISGSSLYAAFGSKAGLFEQAVRRHTSRYRAIYESAVLEPTPARTIRLLLTGFAREFAGEGEGGGCLVGSAAMTDTPDTLDVRGFLLHRQAADEQLLHERLVRAGADGHLPDDVAPDALTDLALTLWHGLATRANLGAGREELMRAAEVASDVVDRALGTG